MTVAELIKALSDMPQDAPVAIIHANQGSEVLALISDPIVQTCVMANPHNSEPRLYARFEVSDKWIIETVQTVLLGYE